MELFVDVGGVKLFCKKTGQGDPILLLHGNGEDHRIFDVLAPQLAEHFTVYAVDSRGHGRSTPVKYYDYTQMAQDIVRMTEVLGIEHPMLYGFSDGGIIGLLIAIHHPGLLKKLVISGANCNPGGLTKFCRAAIRGAFLVSHDPRQELMLTQPNISAEQLRSITVPTMVLAGERDAVRTAHTEALAKTIPGAKLQILPGQNHSSYVVHSDLLYPAMQNFLLGE